MLASVPSMSCMHVIRLPRLPCLLSLVPMSTQCSMLHLFSVLQLQLPMQVFYACLISVFTYTIVYYACLLMLWLVCFAYICICHLLQKLNQSFMSKQSSKRPTYTCPPSEFQASSNITSTLSNRTHSKFCCIR